MKIHYSIDFAYGEPGPNYIWTLNLSELHHLVNQLERLAKHGTERIEFNTDSDVALIGLKKVLLKCEPNGNVLTSSIDDGVVFTNLSPSKWIFVIGLLRSLTTSGQFQYIEIEKTQDELTEESNWIVEVI